MNARSSDLRRAFEAAGFTDVKTVLSSGNVVFNARSSSGPALERRAEAAMDDELGHAFRTVVRSTEHLQGVLDAEVFAGFDLPPAAKRVVTFLHRATPSPVRLPLERDGVHILEMVGAEVFTAYLPHPKGAVFMTLLERTFGKDITTRTVETVRKCVKA